MYILLAGFLKEGVKYKTKMNSGNDRFIFLNKALNFDFIYKNQFLGKKPNPTMEKLPRQLASFGFHQRIVFSLGTKRMTSGMMLGAVRKNGLSAPKRYVLLLQKPQV
mgnify:CR=1 FL=1